MLHRTQYIISDYERYIYKTMIELLNHQIETLNNQIATYEFYIFLVVTLYTLATVVLIIDVNRNDTIYKCICIVVDYIKRKMKW